MTSSDLTWDDIPDVLVCLDADGRWSALSAAWTTLTGLPVADCVGCDCLRDVLPQDRDVAAAVLLNSAPRAAGGSSAERRGEFRLRTASGDFVSVAAHVRRRWLPTGEPAGVAGTLRSEPSARVVSQALAESEARYRSVVLSMAEGVVLHAADGRITTCNPAAERILGLSLAQMQGRLSVDPRWRAVRDDGSPFPGDEHPAMVTLRTGTPLRNVVMGVYRPNGTLAWLNVNSQPMTDPASALPYGVVATFTDVTESRTPAVAVPSLGFALPSAERPTRTGYWVLDEVQRQLTWDDACVELFGCEPHDMPCNMADWLARMHPADQPALLASHQEWKQRGYPDVESPPYRLRTGGGTWRWIRSRRSVMEWRPDRTPARISGTLSAVPAQEEQRLTARVLALCAWCKRVRNRDGMWQMLEEYFEEHFAMPLSHGMCHECADRLTTGRT